MTRINVVHPWELANQHLLAEYRELPRVFNLVRNQQDKGNKPSDLNIPSEYALGKGHVTFFYDKLLYLKNRQERIIQEMIARGYVPQYTDVNNILSGIDKAWCTDYNPTDKAVYINRCRIFNRLHNIQE